MKLRFRHGLVVVAAVLMLLGIRTRAALGPQLVSVRNPAMGVAASGAKDSGAPLLTPDGRYVVFASSAENLVPGTKPKPSSGLNPPRLNVFLRARTTGSTTLVSVNLNGTAGGNGDSWPTGISTNGQFILFESAASDLVTGDSNGAADVFIRDMLHGTTLPVSVGLSGGSGNGASRSSVMTPDGQRVAFVSVATNLVAGDTNQIADVFVRDVTSNTTTVVSTDAAPSNWSSGVSGSEAPCITPDGRYVAFSSTATNLVAGAATQREIYVRDLVAQTTIWASTNAGAIFGSLFGSSNVASFNHAISADGQFVAYEAGPNAAYPASGAGVIIRQNLRTGTADLVSSNAVQPIVYENWRSLDMTPDGRYVAYVVNIGSPGGSTAIYLGDAQTKSNLLVSADLSGAAPAGDCQSPMLSAGGQSVSFVSSAGNLTTNINGGGYHLYVRDLGTGSTELVDADTNGFAAGVYHTVIPSLSSDGRYVAFASASGNLVANDFNQGCDVFVRDLTADLTELESVRDPALPSWSPDGTSAFFLSGVSTNGRFIAFASDADDLVANDTNQYRDVFVRDLVVGTNVLASVSTNGASAIGMSMEPSISGDGRYVAFTSLATNIVAGDTNKARDVFVHDLIAGTNDLVSSGTNGGFGNADSYSPAISGDGRYVVFRSMAQNLAAGVTTGENLFLRDRQLRTTLALTTLGVGSSAMTRDGGAIVFVSGGSTLYVWDLSSGKRTYTNTSASSSSTVGISPDGHRVAYTGGFPVALNVRDLVLQTSYAISTGTVSSASAPRFSGDGQLLVYSTTNALNPRDTNKTYDVYLYDFQSGTNLLVAQSFDARAALNGGSTLPDISSDGRFIACRSSASNCVPNDSNGVSDVFLFDRSNGVTTVVSASLLGAFTANNFSTQPVFSGDGATLFFQSWASDILGADFNRFGDVFSLDLSASVAGTNQTNPGSISWVSPSGNAGAGQLPMLTWPAAFGNTYRVQFKNALSDPFWENLDSDTTIVGSSGYATDLAPAAGQRFYRLVLNP